jgi:N-acetylneuraminic acid mutarotase
MKKLIIYCSLFAVLLSLYTCSEDYIERGFPGVITRSVVQNGTAGIVISGELISRNAKGIREVGFVWQSGNDPKTNPGFKANLISNIKAGPFDIKISNSLKKGTKYYVRAYAITEDYTVYGDLIEFICENDFQIPPYEFRPLTGHVLDTIVISGGLFNKTVSKNSIRVNDLDAEIVEVKDSSIKFIIPLNIETKECSINVTFDGLSTILADKFTLISPTISSFSPLAANPGDTITIFGTGFHLKAELNKILFGNISSTVLTSTSGKILVKAPYPIDSLCFITVSVSKQSSQSSNKILIHMPEIGYFSPSIASYNDTIIIYCNGLNPDEILNISLGGINVNIIKKEGKLIYIKIPEILNKRYSKLVINTQALSFEFPVDFELKQPIINGTSKLEVKYGETITFYGKNFNPNKSLNKVYIGNQGSNFEIIPIFACRDSIKFQFSNIENPLKCIDFNTFTIGIKTCEETFWSEIGVKVLSSWVKLKDFPGLIRYKAFGLNINGKGYLGCGVGYSGTLLNDFYEFDPASNLWTKKSDFPGAGRAYGLSISNSTDGYFGGGFSADNSSKVQLYDFYKYTPTNNLWSRIVDYPDANQAPYIGFTASLNGRCFASLSSSVLLMRELVNDSWQSRPTIQELTDCPTVGTMTIGEKIFVIIGYKINTTPCNTVWEYDTETYIWTQKSNFPGAARYAPVYFSIGNYGYYGCGINTSSIQYKDMWRYDPSNDQWQRIEDFPGGIRSNTVSFSINNFGFVGLGLVQQPVSLFNDFWAYCPK